MSFPFTIWGIQVYKMVSLNINIGQKIVLVGPSGTGKSTLIKLISGLIKPKSGQIFLDQTNIHQQFTAMSNLKSLIKQKILSDKSFFKKLEKIIHPLVRNEMTNFIKKHKNKKFTFFEIPLLVESRLMKKFDLILFIKAKRSLRMKRFKQKGGNKVFFNIC